MRDAITSYGKLWARARASGLAVADLAAKKAQAEAKLLMDRA